jgi:hypothetical protein
MCSKLPHKKQFFAWYHGILALAFPDDPKPHKKIHGHSSESTEPQSLEKGAAGTAGTRKRLGSGWSCVRTWKTQCNDQ